MGDLSVHEVTGSGQNANLAYLSYYSGGFRVIEITRRNTIKEVGHYIAPDRNNFWGVQVFEVGGVK